MQEKSYISGNTGNKGSLLEGMQLNRNWTSQIQLREWLFHQPACHNYDLFCGERSKP